MNEFDEEIMEKKRTAQGAHHMGKRRGITLQVDRMTNRQIEKLHGEVFSMNINETMTWEDFKKLPKKMQLEYYNSLVDRFGVGGQRIADMLGVAKATLDAHMIRNFNDVHKAKKGGDGWDRYAWLEFCSQRNEVQKEPEEQHEAFVAIPKKQEIELTSYHLNFIKVNNWGQIADTLLSLPLPKNAVISINVQEGL